MQEQHLDSEDVNVFSYYHDVLDPRCPWELIQRWRDSWSKGGFTPHLIQEFDASLDPSFSEYESMISRFPSTNEKGWERHCWLRWLAYHQAAPGLFCDWDVINFFLTPDDVKHLSGFVALSPQVSPIFVADRIGTEAVISMIPGAMSSMVEIEGKPHVSDMTMLQQKINAGMIRIERKCVSVGDCEELIAPCVHFNNGSLPPDMRENWRWKAVDDLISRRGQQPSTVLMSEHNTNL